MVNRDKFFRRWLDNSTDENKEKFNWIRTKETKDIKSAKHEQNFKNCEPTLQ